MIEIPKQDKLATATTLRGKVVVITGSNCGIGYEAALDLAGRGSIIILACRDLKKADEARDKIVKSTKSEKIHVLKLDLANLESIREFVTGFKSKFNRLDILINNAGLSGFPFTATKEGFEMHFAVMHIGHFYLTHLLIDVLKKSTARIINVSSWAHKNGKINWERLKTDKKYSNVSAYCQAKLANILFTRELADRYGKDGIVSVSLHPGAVRTEIYRELKEKKNVASVLFYVFSPIWRLITKDVREGAQTTIYCATHEQVQNGQYFSDCKVAKTSKAARDKALATRLWAYSESELNVRFGEN